MSITSSEQRTNRKRLNSRSTFAHTAASSSFDGVEAMKFGLGCVGYGLCPTQVCSILCIWKVLGELYPHTWVCIEHGYFKKKKMNSRSKYCYCHPFLELPSTSVCKLASLADVIGPPGVR